MAKRSTRKTCPSVPDTSYNGWKNYETWAVGLWIDNEEGSYNEAEEMAERAKEEAAEERGDRTARGILADMLKDWLEEGMPEVEGLWADLLNAAFGEVDWYEVAEHYLEE